MWEFNLFRSICYPLQNYNLHWRYSRLYKFSTFPQACDMWRCRGIVCPWSIHGFCVTCLVTFPSKVISYMMLQLSTIWPYNSQDSPLDELCHMSHLACFWFDLIQNYPDVVRVAALYVGISRIFRESSTVDYPTCFDRSSNLERFQARVQRHHYGSCCSVLSAYIVGT